MGIVKKAKKLTQSGNQKGTDLTWDGSRGWSVVRGNEPDDLPDDFQDFVYEGFRRNPVLAACVREIQTSLSEAPIHAYSLQDKNQRIEGHPLEDLFRYPNKRDSYVTFIERSVQHFILGGNSFWQKRTKGNVPFALIPIRPDRIISATTDSDGFPVSFEVLKSGTAGTSSAETETISSRDLVHIPDADPLNEVFGMPRVMAATLDIATDNEATNYVNEVLGNYGSPGTIVTVDAERAKKQMLERAESLWQEKFGPGKGRGKVAFIPGGQNVMQIGFNLRDLEFEALRQVTRESICAAVGVDPMLIGISTASRGGTLSGNEFHEARRKLWLQTLIPMLRRWEAAINAFLSPEFGNVYAQFDIAHIVALQEDREAQIDRARKMVRAGASLQESRVEMGLKPEPDPDDLFILSGRTDIFPVSMFTEDGQSTNSGSNNASGNTAGKRIPDPIADESEDSFIERCMSDPIMTEEYPDENQRLAVSQSQWDDQKAEPNELRILRRDTLKWLRDNPLEKKNITDGVYITPEGSFIGGSGDTKDAYSRFEGFAKSQETAYRLAAQDIFEKQRQEVLRLAVRTMQDPSEESLNKFEDSLNSLMDTYGHMWAKKFRSLYNQTTDAVIGRLMGTVSVDTRAVDEQVGSFIQNRLQLMREANGLTASALVSAAQTAVASNNDVGGVVDALLAVYDDGKGVMNIKDRSELFARTESGEIINATAWAVFDNSSEDWEKSWLSKRDNNVRDEHRAEDDDSHAEPVPVGEDFRVTGRKYAGGYHCRCLTVFKRVV